jgi:ribonuclease H / adenosylcobalamin/alpha-ribazole phosphatase
VPTRVIIEADGGSRGNPGPAAYGALLRDADTGEVIAERAEAIGTTTNNVAEYRGLIAGLELLHQHAPDAEQVEVRMDSKLVIEQMTGRWKIRHPDMRELALEANRRAPFGTTWTWVPRSANARADRLLNRALDAALGVEAKATRATATAADAEQPAPQRPFSWAADLGTPTRMILMRHGQTGHTVGRRFSGSGGADPSLDEVGKAQAETAAAWVESRRGVDAVVTSPAARARETAEVIADALALPVEVDDGLRETSFGAWDGHTFAEVQERWPRELKEWLASTSVAPPRGESFDEVAVRVRRWRDRIIRTFPGLAVVAVTHVTPIKLMVCAALGAPADALFRMDVAPGSISEIEWYSDGLSSLRAFSVQP